MKIVFFHPKIEKRFFQTIIQKSQ